MNEASVALGERAVLGEYGLGGPAIITAQNQPDRLVRASMLISKALGRLIKRQSTLGSQPPRFFDDVLLATAPDARECGGAIESSAIPVDKALKRVFEAAQPPTRGGLIIERDVMTDQPLPAIALHGLGRNLQPRRDLLDAEGRERGAAGRFSCRTCEFPRAPRAARPYPARWR